MPSALIEKPDLWNENKDAFEAFLELNETRQSVMGDVSRITHAEILSYCICYELNPILIIKKVAAADRDYLKWIKEKQQNVQHKPSAHRHHGS